MQYRLQALFLNVTIVVVQQCFTDLLPLSMSNFSGTCPQTLRSATSDWPVLLKTALMGLRCLGIFDDFGNNDGKWQDSAKHCVWSMYLYRAFCRWLVVLCYGSNSCIAKFSEKLRSHMWHGQNIISSRWKKFIRSLEPARRMDSWSHLRVKWSKNCSRFLWRRCCNFRRVTMPPDCNQTNFCWEQENLNLLTSVFTFVFPHFWPWFCWFSPRWWQSMARILLRPCGGSYRRTQTAAWCCWHGATMSLQASRRLFKQRRLSITGQLFWLRES